MQLIYSTFVLFFKPHVKTGSILRTKEYPEVQTLEQSTRRSQPARTEQMRLRLIEATLDCIAEHGYQDSTVSRIVEKAEASRGALLHHFPSKAMLVEAATLHLTKHLYRVLGESFAALSEADDRAEEMILRSWDTVIQTRENRVILDLLSASRNDPELAAMLKRLGKVFMEVLATATQHYFEPRARAENPMDLIMLTQWVIRGMAADYHLVKDKAYLRELLSTWCRVLNTQMKPKRGVNSPPPRPQFWTRHIL